jgi:hypothetical protein
MTTDLFPALSDADRDWAEVAEDAQQILHRTLDADRPVEVDDDGYERSDS